MMRGEISFTAKVKNEMTTKEFSEVKCHSLLAAFVKINGRLNLSQEGDSLILKTENAKIAKLLYSIIQKRYKVNPRFAYVRSMHFDKAVSFHLVIETRVQEIIDDLEMFNFDKNSLSFIHKEDDISGYFIGAFLASGSVNDPHSSNYHLEMAFVDEDDALYAKRLLNRMHSVRFEPKIIKRRSQYVLYLKKSNQIADFLAFINAEEACLDFENVRIYRDFTNNDNRLQICTNANVVRTVESAHRQKEDILIIDKKMGINNIPNRKMRLICQYRLEEEEATMNDLAERLCGELDMSVSKSSVNHIFRAIHELAIRLSKGESHD